MKTTFEIMVDRTFVILITVLNLTEVRFSYPLLVFMIELSYQR